MPVYAEVGAPEREAATAQGHALGWSYTPLAGKRPVLEAWASRPRETLDEALGWARAGNVGVRTGAASRGLVVVDVDLAKGATLDGLDLPPTVTVETGGGGLHFYFRTDEEVRNSAGRLAPHVDVRGEGGQVVAAGSVHPETGEAYRYQDGRSPDEVEVADLPLWVSERLSQRPPRKPGASRDARYARAALEDELRNVREAAEGTRNITLNKAAFVLGQFIGAGLLTREEVEAALLGATALPPEEARATIDSGIRAGMKRPRSRPEARSSASPAAPHGGQPAGGELGGRDPVSGKLVLSPKITLPTAEAFVREFYSHPDGRTIHSYAGSLWAWRGNRYAQREDGALRNLIQPWLHDALRFDKAAGKLVRFESNPTTVNAALQSICDLVHIPEDTPMPGWLDGGDGRPPADELLACPRGNLHIPTGRVLPPTPLFFTTGALAFDHDPEAPEPLAWLAFLRDLWGGDEESIDLLQEWAGYLLTPDTSQQKMLLLVGPRRSGKGTIARVLAELVGRGNVAGPTTSSLAGPFGLQPLIGRTVAIISDARFTGEGVATVVERLLCITGEDLLTIDRKHLPSVSMKLPTRVTVITNELPRLNDASSALAGRFLILRLTQSFYGREDASLTRRLLAELPGILNWALAGRRRLWERGRFVQPASSEEATQELEDLSSPVGAFVRERCVLGPDERVWVDELYAAWCRWCEDDGRTKPSRKQDFGRDLSAAVQGVQRHRARDPHDPTKDKAFYAGINLRGRR